MFFNNDAILICLFCLSMFTPLHFNGYWTKLHTKLV